MKEITKEKAKYQATDRLPEYQNLTDNSKVAKVNILGNDPDLMIEIEVQAHQKHPKA